MASTTTTGTTLEDLLNTEPGKTSSAKNLIDGFALANNKFGIVSSTLVGLLDSFADGSKTGAISVGGIEFCGDSSGDEETSSIEANVNRLLSITKDKEAAQTSDFSDAAGAFVSKVSSVKASYIYDVTPSNPLGVVGIESCENALMRMIGLPDDKEIGGTEKTLLYIDPNSFNVKMASLADMNGTTKGPDILSQRKLNSSLRIYNFDTLKEPTDKVSASPVTIEQPLDGRIPVDYFDTGQQMIFYYLKSVPIQDSEIYGCIFETDKIVMKPFDNRTATKINGNKVYTSLLESILRIRLDRVTGNPGIYPTNTDGLSTFSLEKPSNIGADSITQVECFIIDKLRKVLFQLGDNHIIKAKDRSEAAAKAAAEGGQVSDTLDAAPTEREASEYEDEIQDLEILKAREDAILFLLKDTSKAYDDANVDSKYSSLQLQEGVIRTSSGFDDILSGPLYSILKQKSDYLDSKITQLKAAAYAKSPLPSAKGDWSGTVNSSSGDSYIGVSSEDFVIYCIALLALNQDFLIGLLSQERRVNMANTISGSILSSKKDPYGLIDRVSRSADNGGFPDVVDSVNALAVLVANLYMTYTSYCSGETLKAFAAQYFLDAQKAIADKSKS